MESLEKRQEKTTREEQMEKNELLWRKQKKGY